MHCLLVRKVGVSLFDADGNGPFDQAEFERRSEICERWNRVAWV